ncbi:uncharacterized protein LOC126841936 [Adelges cooleyi]|uniref:uncharacterized protein LOC126841936 n=1 Tax=Adelges cooleyi TaxID=133065 RepID=UPI0021801656|nr:uncharacterized protein LOC126841936 [Adelges cooleyi]XP_050434712.1 uncharacterized protein LOC126841936 [Adelges cooleyi]
MITSMFNSLFKKTKVNKKTEPAENVVAARKDVEKLLLEFIQPKDNTDNEDNHPISKAYSAFELLSLDDNSSTKENDELVFDDASDTSNDTKSESSSERKSKLSLSSEDQTKSKMINKLNNLQCLFTWNLKGKNKYNLSERIKNKYGDFNLDISQPKFTFERFIGNLIISYEMFHNEDKEVAQLKVLEIGKWLEELDNGSDEFYLSINIGLKHVTMSTFAHMVFATNLIEQSRWLLDDIVPFPSLTCKPRAAVHAARAAVLIEYGGNSGYFKKANECAKKACDLDPTSSYWFYLYSIVMSAQRQFLQSFKSCPTEKEKTAIQNAIMLSDGKNTKYNFHRMVLDRETIVSEFHADKNNRDKIKMEKNIKDNRMIVKMIKTILSMDPEDPHLIVQCAKTLITLPYMVRDIQLGKEYLSRAIQMAPNDMTVLKAVTNVIEVSKDINKKKNSEKNQHPAKVNQLGEDLRHIVEKHKKKENAVPYLTDLVAKVNNNNDKWKIVSQICSYSILFNNNLRAGVEQFMMLIEQPNIANSKIITNHYSSFINGCNMINLAELVVNEISLAIVSSNTLSHDLVYYVQVLSKILETCKLNRKDADPLMCSNIKSNSSVMSACSSTTYQKENNLMDNESVDLDSESVHKRRTRNQKSKHLPNTKVFHKSESGNKSNKNASSKSNQNTSSKSNQNANSKKNVQSNAQQKKAKDAEMKYKMEKFLSSTPTPVFPTVQVNDLGSLQTQSDIEKYAKQLYQNIVNRSNQKPPNANPNLYQHFNDNNPGPSFSQQPQNMFFNSQVPLQIPNLATMPQQNPPPSWRPPKPYVQKKK